MRNISVGMVHGVSQDEPLNGLVEMVLGGCIGQNACSGETCSAMLPRVIATSTISGEKYGAHCGEPSKRARVCGPTPRYNQSI